MKGFLTSIFVFLFLFSNSQTLVKTTGEKGHSKQDTISALKDLVLCSCIINGFPGDSLDSKDPSLYVLMETKGICIAIMDSINLFARNFVSSMPTTRPGQNRESTYKKRIMTGYISLYKSKKLDLFVKNLYSKHRELFTQLPE